MDPQTRIPDHQCSYLHGPIGREAAEAHIQSMGCSDGMFLVRRKDKYTMAITLAFKNKISHLLIETGTFYTLKSNDVFDRALCLDELIQQMRLVRQGWATPLETPVTRTMIKAGQDAIGLAKWKARAPVASIEHMVSTGSTGGGQHSRIRRENSSNGDGVLSSKRGPRGLPHGLLEEADAGPNAGVEDNEMLKFNPDEICRIRSDDARPHPPEPAGAPHGSNTDMYVTLDDCVSHNPRDIVPAVSGVRLSRDQPAVEQTLTLCNGCTAEVVDEDPGPITTVDFVAPQYGYSVGATGVRESVYCGVEPAVDSSLDVLYDDAGRVATTVTNTGGDPLYDSNPNILASGTASNPLTASASASVRPRGGSMSAQRPASAQASRPISIHGPLNAQRTSTAALRQRSASIAARPVSSVYHGASQATPPDERRAGGGGVGGGISRRRLGSIADERRAFHLRMSTKGGRDRTHSLQPSTPRGNIGEHGSPPSSHNRMSRQQLSHLQGAALRNSGFNHSQHHQAAHGDVAAMSAMMRTMHVNNDFSGRASGHGASVGHVSERTQQDTAASLQHRPRILSSDHDDGDEDNTADPLYAHIDDMDSPDEDAASSRKPENDEAVTGASKSGKKGKKRLGNLFKSFKKGPKHAGDKSETGGLPVRSYTDVQLLGFVPVDHLAQEKEVLDAIRKARRLNATDQVPVLNAELSITPTTVMMCTITSDELMSTALSSVTYVYTDSSSDTQLLAFVHENGVFTQSDGGGWACDVCGTRNIRVQLSCIMCFKQKPGGDDDSEADNICVILSASGDTSVGLKKKFELSMTASNLPMQYDDEDSMRANGAVDVSTDGPSSAAMS